MWIYWRDGRHIAPVAEPKSKNVIIVRARRADDLDALRNTHMPTLGPNKFDSNRDYNVRARIDKADFVQGMTYMAIDIDYPSYKETVHKTTPGRYSVISKIWDATLALSDCAPAEKHRSIYARDKGVSVEDFANGNSFDFLKDAK